jgi:hypothetical protein
VVRLRLGRERERHAAGIGQHLRVQGVAWPAAGGAITLRFTSPQAAMVSIMASLSCFMSGPRPDFTTPWNWKLWREVMRRVWLP